MCMKNEYQSMLFTAVGDKLTCDTAHYRAHRVTVSESDIIRILYINLVLFTSYCQTKTKK